MSRALRDLRNAILKPSASKKILEAKADDKTPKKELEKTLRNIRKK